MRELVGEEELRIVLKLVLCVSLFFYSCEDWVWEGNKGLWRDGSWVDGLLWFVGTYLG